MFFKVLCSESLFCIPSQVHKIQHYLSLAGLVVQYTSLSSAVDRQFGSLHFHKIDTSSIPILWVMKLRQARLVTFKSQNLVSGRAGYWDLGSLGPVPFLNHYLSCS